MAVAAEKITEVIHAYLAALEASDVDAIVALYAEDATCEDPVGQAPVRTGLTEIREFYTNATAFPIKAEMHDVRISDNEVLFRFSIAMEMGDTTMTVEPVDHMVFNDEGKVVAMRAFWGQDNVTTA